MRRYRISNQFIVLQLLIIGFDIMYPGILLKNS